MPYIVWLMLCSCLVHLSGVPLAAAGDYVQTTTQPQAKTVLFFGDSLTAGYGLDPAQAFPALIQAKITARGWDLQVINAGLSGETTAGGLRRIDWVLQQRPIAVLVLALGANDGLRGLPLVDAKRNLQVIIDRTRHTYPQAKIVLAGMQVPTTLGREYATGFRTIFPELAAVNAATLIPFLLEGVAGIHALNLPDGIHPNPAGHKMIAENVWRVLEPILRFLQAP
jgi:acyl-CoA thioesterase I